MREENTRMEQEILDLGETHVYVLVTLIAMSIYFFVWIVQWYHTQGGLKLLLFFKGPFMYIVSRTNVSMPSAII